jgi:hypothetical protein
MQDCQILHITGGFPGTCARGKCDNTALEPVQVSARAIRGVLKLSKIPR